MSRNPAHARGTRSFFAYESPEAGSVGLCRGLSCELNGGADLHARLAGGHECFPVFCLGMCDRSPAILTAGERVLCGASALQWPDVAGQGLPPMPVDVRAISRRAIVTERIGIGPHASLDRARGAGVYQALSRAIAAAPAQVLAQVEASGEQGRGGAGFPTGSKWRSCAATAAEHRYVVANGDEGDPGSFIDRVLLEDDPHAVLEGLLLCAFAVGAREAIVYIRAEYPRARACMAQAIAEAREAGYLGPAVLGSGFSCEVRLATGQGSYVCGEETALLNAIEGRRGEARVRPPYPATAGLFGCPTVVNNIETLVNIPWILREGPAAFRALGTAASPGTKAFCFNRGFARPGIVEAEFGVTLAELIDVHAGGARDGRPLLAVALGGPMGSVLSPADFDVVVDQPVLAARGIRLGHGGLVAIPAGADLAGILRSWVEFMAAESCGRCVPCGLGSQRLLGMARSLTEGGIHPAALAAQWMALLDTIEAGSLCGFGQGIPGPLRKLWHLWQSRDGTDG
ncbi:MAG: hypothetical protein IT486_01325 [Gammaproteobacteria bacterium]|nr:hypothetical protein [Gammaproteobacteria bacterium]